MTGSIIAFGEQVSAMGGPDVGVIQPPFSILPRESCFTCGNSNGELRTDTIVIDNIPFAYAIPMLTGWEVGYLTSDQHVKEIGIWIDDLHYDRDPNGSTGTLRYTVSSDLHDDDRDPGNYYRHKVTILGLRPLAGVDPSGADETPRGADETPIWADALNSLVSTICREGEVPLADQVSTNRNDLMAYL